MLIPRIPLYHECEGDRGEKTMISRIRNTNTQTFGHAFLFSSDIQANENMKTFQEIKKISQIYLKQLLVTFMNG